MKRKKLSNKTKGKILISIPILLIVGILIGIFISQFRFDVFFDKVLPKITNDVLDRGLQWGIIILLGCFAFLFLLCLILDGIIPLLLFFVGRPLKYLAIWCTCRKKGYACRFSRAPFASLKGVDKCDDIEIQMDGKKLFLHFVDIPLPVLKIFVLLNDREYRMHLAIPGDLEGFGIRRGPRKIDYKHYTAYSIPEFPSRDKEYHCLVLDLSYADAYFMKGQIMHSITGECTSGNVIVCRWKVLRKRLKHELHAHFESLKHKEDY